MVAVQRQRGVLPGAAAPEQAAPRQKVSVFSEIERAGHALASLCAAPPPDFAAQLRLQAQAVERASALDADAALAHVLLGKSLPYPIRQMVNCAVIAAVMKARPGQAEDAALTSLLAAALTMNVSMLDVQAALYANKEMTDAQRAAVRAHPQASAALLRERGVTDATWLQLVEQHHELLDGSGYPAALQGDAIVRDAQVLALADRYCSMVTERAYRPAITSSVALKEIHARNNGTIEPALIGQLVALMGVYPPGTLVALNNAEYGVVTRRLRDVKHPVVHTLCMTNLAPFETPRKRLTASQPQFEIERVLGDGAIPFAIDPEALWPRSAAEPELAS
ncbi:MAG: HD-GYP domain-containing protein [Betaproteobacteria bacterium]